MLRLLILALALSLSSSAAAQEVADAEPISLPGVDTHLASLAATAARLGGHMGLLTQPRPRMRAIKRIVIDPGHGGTNEGAVGVGGLLEKHLNLAISLHLADRLRERYPDLEIALTRRDDVDVSLAERIDVANALEADLFLSVHLNAALNTEAKGFETFWIQDTSPILPPGELDLAAAAASLDALPEQVQAREHAAGRAMRFCEHAQRGVVGRMGSVDRGVKRGNYTVLRRALVPAAVIELGFLTHAEEGMSLLDPAHQAELVEALIHSIESYDAALAEAP